jgi:transposase
VGQLRKKSRQKIYIPLSYEPGETAQVDFGEAEVIIAGKRETAHLFVTWLGYSGATYVQAYPAETQAIFFAGHVAAFDFYGGVPREIWYDNLKIAVNKMLKGRNRKEQDAFIGFRSHYLYQAQFCNVRAGWEKGGVEGRVGYVRRNWLVPIEEFESWSALNDYLHHQCEEELKQSGPIFCLRHPIPIRAARSCPYGPTRWPWSPLPPTAIQFRSIMSTNNFCYGLM